MENKENFYKAVYEVVAQIPEGQVATYGGIAKRIGKPRCARTVGYAMWNLPKELNLPAHRVVNRSGEMAPEYVFGGKQFQRILLESEGITFNEKGNINMKLHQWI